MTSPVACTIVANNYLAYARVLTRSFLEQHPDGRMVVLVVDRPHAGIRYDEEPFATVFVEELGIPAFPHYAFRYSILELNTAVKPRLLLHLHRTLGCDRICYFDPDILVLASLEEIYLRLGAADAVLTPHIEAPIEDGLTPGERDFLLSGIYNLGFLGIAFNERTLPFLDWWRRRLDRECLHAVERGLFVDQRWMDFAPAFLPRAAIWHDPGCNVAYWNLMHRTVVGRDGAWWVGGSPLRFFHFSGFNADRPDLISKYQNRFTLDERPDLQPLFRSYGERLAAAGHGELKRLDYVYGRFDDGTPVPEVARMALRWADPDGRRWADPFATGGPDSFLAWLLEPDDPAAQITLPRLAFFVWERRGDLQQAFPHPGQADRAAFAEWFVQQNESQEIGQVFTRPVARSLRRLGASPADRGDGLHQVQHRMDEGAIAGDPLANGLTAEEIAWLATDAGYEPGRRPRVPRMAMMLHRRRADLQGTYPEPLGADRTRFMLWYATNGRAEYELPPGLVNPILHSLTWRQAAWAWLWWQRRQRQRRLILRSRRTRPEGARREAEPAARAPLALSAPPDPGPDAKSGGERSGGINIVGWAAAPTGVGEACRSTLAALAATGQPHALWSLGGSASDDASSGSAGGVGGDGLPYDVNLFHVNADMIEIIHRQLPRALTAGRYAIGYWFWELAFFPLCFTGAFRCVDEVWAPTRFCLEAYRSLSPVEVRWVPPAIVPPVEAPADRRELGVGAGSFLFFFAFDALSIPERKNPTALLRAFGRAVRDSPRPLHLLLKVNHLEAEPALAEQLRELAHGLPVTLLARSLPRSAMNSLTAACDAYVSLHRSEGLGMPLIEAMFLGKPVIATDYGGSTDFLDAATGWPVRYSLVPLDRQRGPYPAGAVWAEPDVEHAAACLLAVVNEPEAAAARAAAGRQRVAETYAPAAAGERLRREIARIQAARGCGRRA